MAVTKRDFGHMGRDVSRQGSDNRISIGGSVQGSAVAAGDHNRQEVHAQIAPEDRETLLTALGEIRQILGTLSGPYAPSAQANADAAIAQASAPDADPSAVAAALDMALDAAKKTAEFGDVFAKIAPWVARLAPLVAASGIQFAQFALG